MMFATAAFAADADLSSPKATAKTLFNAINAGDRDVVRDAIHCETPEQAEVISALTDLILAGKALGDAAQRRYGPIAQGIGGGMLRPEDLAKLEAAKVEPWGDNAARMILPDQPRPMMFRRRDGKWRLSLLDLRDATPQSLARQAKLYRQMAEALHSGTAEIASGAHPTADAAVEAIQQRLHDVMLQLNRSASTGPSTIPSSAPTSAPAHRQ